MWKPISAHQSRWECHILWPKAHFDAADLRSNLQSKPLPSCHANQNVPSFAPNHLSCSDLVTFFSRKLPPPAHWRPYRFCLRNQSFRAWHTYRRRVLHGCALRHFIVLALVCEKFAMVSIKKATFFEIVFNEINTNADFSNLWILQMPLHTLKHNLTPSLQNLDISTYLLCTI